MSVSRIITIAAEAIVAIVAVNVVSILQQERAQQMRGAHLVLGTLNGELVGSAYGLFCFCCEVVEWRHKYFA